MSSTLPDDPLLVLERQGIGGALAVYRRRIAEGDVGNLPVILGVVLIWAIFQYASDGVFMGSFNLVNLSLQMAAVGTIAVGVVFVLLIGEIDLSVGIVSGLCAGVMAVLNVKMGYPAPIAVLLAVLAGSVIGLIQGLWITRFRIPSFVVSLAGLIGWQGALLYILGDTGTINLNNPFITNLAGTFLTGAYAWGAGALFVAYFAITALTSRSSRQAAGLSSDSMVVVLVRLAVIAVAVGAALYVWLQDRGLPLSIVFFVGLILVMDYLVRRTRFGRMVFAVGGNAEAARRAGISVDRVRLAVYVLCSTFAAWGGVLAASRLGAVARDSGGGDVLLNAIASAVIGGTSLFGGRGSVWAALLGVLVIQSIANGMALLSLASSVQFMVTGAVLLAAVTIDAVARRGRQAAGRV